MLTTSDRAILLRQWLTEAKGKYDWYRFGQTVCKTIQDVNILLSVQDSAPPELITRVDEMVQYMHRKANYYQEHDTELANQAIAIMMLLATIKVHYTTASDAIFKADWTMTAVAMVWGLDDALKGELA